MKAIKLKIRDLVLMRLACELAQQISDIKYRLLDDSSSQFQQANLISRMASLANVLILLKLPEKMRPAFFKFAIKQNLKIRNFAAALKIVQFWQKSLCFDESAKAKMQEYESLCRKNNSQNYTSYHGCDCPACGANLSFGLATPQCGKCKARIGICYKSLTPILKADSFKCHVCLAEFSSDNLNSG